MKILILTSMFSKDLEEHYNIFLEKTNKDKYGVFSPQIVMKHNDDNYFKMFSVLKSIQKNSLLEFMGDYYKKDIIYVGPALKSIKFDHIFCIYPDIVLSQEAFLKESIIGRLEDLEGFDYEIYCVKDAAKTFNNINEALEYLAKEIF